jgi:hypothetical protein
MAATKKMVGKVVAKAKAKVPAKPMARTRVQDADFAAKRKLKGK